MPYVAERDNRYLGEHNCRQYHYGDQTILRDCCIEDCIKRGLAAHRLALTDQHPAVFVFNCAWNSLTAAECAIVKARLFEADITAIGGYALA